MCDLPTYEQITGWLGPEWGLCWDTWAPIDGEINPRFSPWHDLDGNTYATPECNRLHLRHSSSQRVVVKAPDGGLSTQCWESLFWSIKRHDIHEPERGLSHYDKCVTWLDEPDQAKCAACGEPDPDDWRCADTEQAVADWLERMSREPGGAMLRTLDIAQAIRSGKWREGGG